MKYIKKTNEEIQQFIKSIDKFCTDCVNNFGFSAINDINSYRELLLAIINFNKFQDPPFTVKKRKLAKRGNVKNNVNKRDKAIKAFMDSPGITKEEYERQLAYKQELLRDGICPLEGLIYVNQSKSSKKSSS